MWEAIWSVLNMPATFGGQLTITGGVITTLAALSGMVLSFRKTYRSHAAEEKARWKHEQENEEIARQHREWLEILMIDYARHTGYQLPRDLIERHMQINGNRYMSSEEKERLYGPNRPPSGDKHKSARSEDKEK